MRLGLRCGTRTCASPASRRCCPADRRRAPSACACPAQPARSTATCTARTARRRASTRTSTRVRRAERERRRRLHRRLGLLVELVRAGVARAPCGRATPRWSSVRPRTPARSTAGLPAGIGSTGGCAVESSALASCGSVSARRGVRPQWSRTRRCRPASVTGARVTPQFEGSDLRPLPSWVAGVAGDDRALEVHRWSARSNSAGGLDVVVLRASVTPRSVVGAVLSARRSGAGVRAVERDRRVADVQRALGPRRMSPPPLRSAPMRRCCRSGCGEIVTVRRRARRCPPPRCPRPPVTRTRRGHRRVGVREQLPPAPCAPVAHPGMRDVTDLELRVRASRPAAGALDDGADDRRLAPGPAIVIRVPVTECGPVEAYVPAGRRSCRPAGAVRLRGGDRAAQRARRRRRTSTRPPSSSRERRRVRGRRIGEPGQGERRSVRRVTGSARRVALPGRRTMIVRFRPCRVRRRCPG